ncbi:MAG: hypothetical protein V4844_08430 [Pseudomonadota bacterium]
MSAARRNAAALLALAAGAIHAAPPPPLNAGLHAAELCVATLPRPASCGPAKVEVRADGSMRLRVDDIAYTLQLHSSQVDVIVMHNIVQIDGFTAPYEWLGPTLQFVDHERRSRYEIRFMPAKR